MGWLLALQEPSSAWRRRCCNAVRPPFSFLSHTVNMHTGSSTATWGFPGGSDKPLHTSRMQTRVCLKCHRPRFDTWVGKIPWRREWLPTPVLLSEKCHGQKEPCGPQSMGPQRVRHGRMTNTFTTTQEGGDATGGRQKRHVTLNSCS